MLSAAEQTATFSVATHIQLKRRQLEKTNDEKVSSQ